MTLFAQHMPPIARLQGQRRAVRGIACAVLVLVLTVGPVWRPGAPAGNTGLPFLELCSAAKAPVIVQGSASPSPRAPAPAEMHSQHCPWCVTSTVALGMPPAAFSLRIPAQIVRDIAKPGVPEPAGSSFWPCVRPRPPPVFG
jgi:hypothetical protein